MSSGFISEAELTEQRRIRQEEWEKVRKPDQPKECPEEEYDHRSLFERLEEQKNKRELEYEEAHRLKNMIKGLDDDEVEFLDLVDRSKLEEERRKCAEEAREMKDFRNAVATLQEKSLEERINTEIRSRLPTQTGATSGRSSQTRLLAGAVVRKRSADASQFPEEKKPRTEDKESCETTRKRKEREDEDTQNGGVVGVGMQCIGILPGLGMYPDSSDSEQSSDTDQELASGIGYDLLGRKVSRHVKSKSSTSSSSDHVLQLRPETVAIRRRMRMFVKETEDVQLDQSVSPVDSKLKNALQCDEEEFEEYSYSLNDLVQVEIQDELETTSRACTPQSCNENDNDSKQKQKKKKSGKLKRREILEVGNTYSCETCGKEFRLKGLLRRHSLMHKENRLLYPCEICKKKYTRRYYLDIHRRIHNNERPFSCHFCEKSFTQKIILDVHVRTHTGDRPFACDVCKKMFTRRDHLVKHCRGHTGDRPYSCDICNKSFIVKGALKKHFRVHTGDHPYTCEVCGSAFTEKSSLNRHFRSHFVQESFPCQVCDKSFTRKSSLTKHMRIHDNTRPHSCEICGRAFNDKGELRNHFRIHTGDRPFSCQMCEKTFTFRNCLTRHIRTHTGERPYACSMCEKRFSDRKGLNRHIKKYPGEH